MNIQKKSNVLITGMGSVTPFGLGVEPLWNAILENKSCIQDGLGKISYSLPPLDDKNLINNLDNQVIMNSRSFKMTSSAISQAMKQAGWDELNSDDGIILASTTGLIELWEKNFIEFCEAKESSEDFSYHLKHEPLGVLLESICKTYNFTGHRTLVSTACAASTQAIMMAHNWIKSGKVKRCLVGGVEVLSALTIEGFKSLQLISESPARPFDIDRVGINLSEGAAFLCLEAKNENEAKGLATIEGGGTSCDAYHMTAPHPEGRGCFQAIEMALKQACISPDEVTMVHAHGTGSGQNDLAECMAISNTFKNCTIKPYVTSTKSVHGHSLAASGILESVISVFALNNNLVLKTKGLKVIDPAISPDLRFIVDDNQNQEIEINHILKTTLGFGGVNAAIVFGKNKDVL